MVESSSSRSDHGLALSSVESFGFFSIAQRRHGRCSRRRRRSRRRLGRGGGAASSRVIRGGISRRQLFRIRPSLNVKETLSFAKRSVTSTIIDLVLVRSSVVGGRWVEF